MGYVNRMFFRKDTGDMIYRYYMEGDITVPTVEQDLEVFEPLKNFNKEYIAVIDIPKEDIKTIDNCRNARSIKLNVETNELVFDFTPEQIEEIEKRKTLEEEIAELKQLVADLASLQLGV